jgi:hypothetical protein
MLVGHVHSPRSQSAPHVLLFCFLLELHAFLEIFEVKPWGSAKFRRAKNSEKLFEPKKFKPQTPTQRTSVSQLFLSAQSLIKNLGDRRSLNIEASHLSARLLYIATILEASASFFAFCAIAKLGVVWSGAEPSWCVLLSAFAAYARSAKRLRNSADVYKGVEVASQRPHFIILVR